MTCVQGYASRFGVVDLSGDVVERGAFVRSLARRPVRFLYQHDASEPIGVFREIHEDDTGLFIRAEINVHSRRGRDAYHLVAQGALSGLSIGFNVVGARKDRASGRRIISAIDLWEVSLVTFPMLPEAVARLEEPPTDEQALALWLSRATRTVLT